MGPASPARPLLPRERETRSYDTRNRESKYSGRPELTIGGQRLVAGPGDEVFIPEGAVHSVKNNHDATTYWLYGYD